MLRKRSVKARGCASKMACAAEVTSQRSSITTRGLRGQEIGALEGVGRT